MGNHGMKAVFSDSAYRSTSSALRSTRLYKVLHGDDVGVRARLLKLVDGRLGHADVADLALLPQQCELTELVGRRHLLVDVVQLVRVDVD